jgi:hypothetical protein
MPVIFHQLSIYAIHRLSFLAISKLSSKRPTCEAPLPGGFSVSAGSLGDTRVTVTASVGSPKASIFKMKHRNSEQSGAANP